ncbi:MAG: hypothetical protein WA081_10665 [Desulfosalsimonadaceae bacterium]
MMNDECGMMIVVILFDEYNSFELLIKNYQLIIDNSKFFTAFPFWRKEGRVHHSSLG